MEFPAVFEVAPYALALNRFPGGEYAYVNAEWSKLLGFSKQEVLGKTTSELGMYQESGARQRFFEILQRDKRVRGYEIAVRTKAGEARLVACNVDLIELEGETFFLSAIEDITARRRTELELKRSQESLLFALESARMGTWEIDLQTGRIQCSPMMLQLWGLDPRDFNGDRSRLQAKVHPDDLENMRAAIVNAIENRSVYELEYRIRPAPGVERWVNSRGRCTYLPGRDQPVRFSGVVFDVTEQRKARELAEMAVKARDNMISISAHELLTPISGIKLRLQTLRMKLEKGAELNRESILKIAVQNDHNLNRLSKLVKDMLDISRINLGKFTLHCERTDLSRVVSNAVDGVHAALESAGCTLKLSIEPGIDAEIDPYRIEQVISNLISNACRYGSGMPVEIILNRSRQLARLTIADQGIGIDEKDHQRIFERFERATTLNQNAGLGLGLFLVKQIVEAHQGRVLVDSRLGHGSRFTVELPLPQEKEPAHG